MSLKTEQHSPGHHCSSPPVTGSHSGLSRWREGQFSHDDWFILSRTTAVKNTNGPSEVMIKKERKCTKTSNPEETISFKCKEKSSVKQKSRLKSHNKYIFLFLRKRHYSQQSKSKQVWNKSKKISKSLLKDQIRHNKDNKGGFQAVKMFISTHNSLKTTCRCILSLSVTDIMWGRALGVKCRWQTGLM